MFQKASLGLSLAAVVALSLFFANAFSAGSHRAEAASTPVQQAALAASPDGNCVVLSNTFGSTNSVCLGGGCGFFANSCLGNCGFFANSCFGGSGNFGGCGALLNSCLGGGCSFNSCFGGCNLNLVFCGGNSCFAVTNCALGSCVQSFSCAGTLCGINASCFAPVCGVGIACAAACGFSTFCPNLGFVPAPIITVPANQIVFSAFPNAGSCGSFLDLSLRAVASSGQPVADGTTIGLTTTLGSVSATVTTDGGSAVARLVIDPKVRGTATITATAPNGVTGQKTLTITCAA